MRPSTTVWKSLSGYEAQRRRGADRRILASSHHRLKRTGHELLPACTRLLPLICIAILVACGANNAAPALPADTNRIAATSPPITSYAPTVAPTLTPSATPAPPPATPPATSADQYRAWMDEARIRYPYSEPVEQMWELMLCESSGNPDLIAGPYHGLFQYAQETWEGDWNPYRDRPILDPQAQIFATAKAWHDGNQSWWGCYRG